MNDVQGELDGGHELWVKADGTLDDGRVTDRQVLYVNRSGKAIERFRVYRDGQPTDYVLKPMESQALVEREIWLQTYFIPQLEVRTPRLVDWSSSGDNAPWVVYPYLGVLEHELDSDAVAEAARSAWLWHNMKVSLPADFRGQKPGLADTMITVRDEWARIQTCMERQGLSLEDILSLRSIASLTPDEISQEVGVVHGDYHYENVTVLDGKITVLDWEFVHNNHVLWDLYTLLDMPHPRYRKQVTVVTRKRALEAYATVRAGQGYPVESDFALRYYAYASVYSLWMLWLIEEDLIHRRWPEAELLACRAEAVNSLRVCVQELPSLFGRTL